MAPRKKKPGPVPKLADAKRRRKLLDGIRRGLTLRLAAMWAGVSFDTFNEYRKANPAFDESVDMAIAARALKWLDKSQNADKRGGDIDRAADRAQEMLARCHPEEYGRKDTTKLIGGDQDQAPIRIVAEVDHRSAIAPATSRPVGDRPSPGEDSGL